MGVMMIQLDCEPVIYTSKVVIRFCFVFVGHKIFMKVLGKGLGNLIHKLQG